MEQGTMAGKLWQSGFDRCVRNKGSCRLRPCTAAQDILCCGDCPWNDSCDSCCEKIKTKEAEL